MPKKINEDKFDDIVNQLQKYDGIARKDSKEVLFITDISGNDLSISVCDKGACGAVVQAPSVKVPKAKIAKLFRMNPANIRVFRGIAKNETKFDFKPLIEGLTSTITPDLTLKQNYEQLTNKFLRQAIPLVLQDFPGADLNKVVDLIKAGKIARIQTGGNYDQEVIKFSQSMHDLGIDNKTKTAWLYILKYMKKAGLLREGKKLASLTESNIEEMFTSINVLKYQNGMPISKVCNKISEDFGITPYQAKLVFEVWNKEQYDDSPSVSLANVRQLAEAYEGNFDIGDKIKFKKDGIVYRVDGFNQEGDKVLVVDPRTGRNFFIPKSKANIKYFDLLENKLDEEIGAQPKFPANRFIADEFGKEYKVEGWTDKVYRLIDTVTKKLIEMPIGEVNYKFRLESVNEAGEAKRMSKLRDLALKGIQQASFKYNDDLPIRISDMTREVRGLIKFKEYTDDEIRTMVREVLREKGWNIQKMESKETSKKIVNESRMWFQKGDNFASVREGMIVFTDREGQPYKYEGVRVMNRQTGQRAKQFLTSKGFRRIDTDWQKDESVVPANMERAIKAMLNNKDFVDWVQEEYGIKAEALKTDINNPYLNIFIAWQKWKDYQGTEAFRVAENIASNNKITEAKSFKDAHGKLWMVIDESPTEWKVENDWGDTVWIDKKNHKTQGFYVNESLAGTIRNASKKTKHRVLTTQDLAKASGVPIKKMKGMIMKAKESNWRHGTYKFGVRDGKEVVGLKKRPTTPTIMPTELHQDPSPMGTGEEPRIESIENYLKPIDLNAKNSTGAIFHKQINEETTVQGIIQKVIGRYPKCRPIAVENFLSSSVGLPYGQQLSNLGYDTASYNWKSPTVNAIRQGLLDMKSAGLMSP